ncbi:MAG: SDR family oxidoreductase [Rhodococcus sp. (in: high G+C Gram-positive bacteria)]
MALCVVIGATGALGTAVTTRLVAAGHRVLAVARSETDLDVLASRFDGVLPCVADIGSDDAIETISSSIDAPVRLAVFSAGLPVRGSADSIDPAGFAVAANIKVGGVVRLLRAVRDHLEPGSRFVAVAGSLGVEPGPLDAGPGTANAALLNIMRQIGALYGPRGITTHTIAPGPIDTPRLDSIIARESDENGTDVEVIRQRYVSKTSLGRLPTLDEVAWSIEILLAPEASVLHGSVLTVDGGVRRGIL